MRKTKIVRLLRESKQFSYGEKFLVPKLVHSAWYNIIKRGEK